MTDQILEALELGLDATRWTQMVLRSAQPNPTTELDDNVRKIEAAIALYKSLVEDKP